jgi:membrane-associated phospholipid phosphatase
VRTEGLLSALSALLLASACATAPAVRTAPAAPPDPPADALETPAPEDSIPFPALLKNDATELASAPLRWGRSDWLKLGIGIAAVGGIALIDHDLRESVDGGSTDTTRRIARAVGPFGAEYSFGVLGGFFLAGKLLDDDKSLHVAEDGLAASLIAAGAITPLMKSAFGRRRPSQTRGTVELGEGGESFPSGHSTQAFAIASVVASHYDSIWVKAGAYALAGLVGWSRMEEKAHYASDVVAGALIGIVVGNAVVRLHESQRFRISAAPTVNRGSAGVALTFGTSLEDVLRYFKSD